MFSVRAFPTVQRETDQVNLTFLIDHRLRVFVCLFLYTTLKYISKMSMMYHRLRLDCWDLCPHLVTQKGLRVLVSRQLGVTIGFPKFKSMCLAKNNRCYEEWNALAT